MTPKWPPKSPTWLYRQDFAKFSLNRHYNRLLTPLARSQNFRVEMFTCGATLEKVIPILSGASLLLKVQEIGKQGRWQQ
ncbi:hypothetical protein TNCV_4733291, partial [Trichonephila clavipes]